MPLFRVLRAFLAGFMGFVWVCVVLVLCVACVGFCARVELGGLEACGVFCLYFISFAPALVLLSCFRGLLSLASCLACSAAFLALWVGFFAWLGCCFFFPFGRLQT